MIASGMVTDIGKIVSDNIIFFWKITVNMKVKFKCVVVLVGIIMLGASCARIVDVVDRPSAPEIKLFESAERKFAASEYDHALALYQQYLDQYPAAGMVPAAMLKIGMIRTEQEEFENARDIYSELIQRFPETDVALRAEVETLFAYFREGRYDAVIDYNEKMKKDRFPLDMQTRISIITGDAYLETRSYDKSFAQFLEGFFHAPNTRWRMHAGNRLAEAAAYVEIARLEDFMEALDGEAPFEYLFYGKCLNLARAGRIGEATALLYEFADRFPYHELGAKVTEKIEAFEQMAYFEGHRIGVLLPLTGQFGPFGQNALRGIELALAEYSRNTAVDPPLEIMVYDTGGDKEKTIQGVGTLAKNKVAAIIGPIVMAEAAATEAQAMGVPIVTLSQRAGITKIGDFVFRNFLTPEMQVNALVDYATDTLGLERFAVLYPDEAYGETFLHLFWDRLLEKNGVMMGAEKYNPEKTDFSDPIKRLVGMYYDVPDELKVVLEEDALEEDAQIVDSMGIFAQWGTTAEETDIGEETETDAEEEDKAIVDFEAVFIPDSPHTAGMIVPQLRYHDINDVYLLGTNLWHSQRLVDIAGRQLRQVVIPEGFYSKSRRPDVNRFMARFKDIYGNEPGIIEASGYDSAMIVFGLVTQPEVDNRVALKHMLLDMPPFFGVTGETVFDENGEAIKKLYLLQIIRGQFSEIGD